MRAGGLPDRPILTGRYCRLGPADRCSEYRTWQDSGGLRPIVALLVTQQPIPLAVPVEDPVIVCDLGLELGVAQQTQVSSADELIIGAARRVGDIDPSGLVNGSRHSTRRSVRRVFTAEPVHH